MCNALSLVLIVSMKEARKEEEYPSHATGVFDRNATLKFHTSSEVKSIAFEMLMRCHSRIVLPHSRLHNKRSTMFLVQNARVQHLTSRRPQKLDAKVMFVHQTDRGIAEVIRIGKDIARVVTAHAAQAFDGPGSASNDIHRGLRIVHASWVDGLVVYWQEALRVVDMSQDGQIYAVFVD